MDKRQEMLKLLEEFEVSGMTQRDFSASKGMGFHKFNYWYRKLNKEQMGGDQLNGFFRVDAGTVGSSGRDLELIYPNGVKLKLNAGDLSLVSRLIRLY
ncbi:IS66 family insertion sequence element accessory protein TnpA [Cecembia lonarensis]|uniref:Transposase n=1 Tax=Cecembia lonarensis (strain CCUG 58316 / KCTC 22772 / LW9) TaxID=1225176 RepID=K1LGA3_CECL9|nr:hypothetical protein [Cecembia lonarensis]EKB51207.1 hypothetical protein B879_00258 [Cecembia lonarensis LW9]